MFEERTIQEELEYQIEEKTVPSTPLEKIYKPTYSLKFSNGLTLTNLYLNGTNFVSETQVSIPDEIFSSIIVENDGVEEYILHNVRLIQQIYVPDNFPSGYYFCFLELSQQEQDKIRLEALEDAMLTMLLSQESEVQSDV